MVKERLAERFERIEAAIAPVLEREGFEIVDLEFSGGAKRSILRITVDRLGRDHYVGSSSAAPAASEREGVTITDCVRVSKLLGPLLDVEELIPTAYNLEVSSPGVHRPLRTPRHFQLAHGLMVRIKTRIPVEGESFFIAKLEAADDEGITLALGERQVRIPYRHVSKANIEFQF